MGGWDGWVGGYREVEFYLLKPLQWSRAREKGIEYLLRSIAASATHHPCEHPGSWDSHGTSSSTGRVSWEISPSACLRRSG